MADLKVSGGITGGGAITAPTGNFTNINDQLNKKQDKLSAQAITTNTLRSGQNDTVTTY